ncbi:stimulated by retinoic acid gene 6 protein-like [Ruditapes philippinarum]|uniref:stimulated by retinoic acid gene 6 protein-like n=1 Tax=Ruditapes philippinarum TaxID=129788 RepID=UPI00295B8D78|nr:stimulated by retinoic acid gene 6 protein-like [Ruditapes philippinarum]
MLFSFSFFMFFYNIFIGILSCMLRIIKSIIIGTIFLPRLDISPLPRRFQMLDPGFANYCGFIHTECSHTNPVMIMFLRILMENTEKHRQTEVKMKKTVDIEANGLSIQARTRARTNWYLLYTLHNNPTIRVYRKSYLDYVKQVQERFAKQYKMNKSSIGNLVKHVNKSLVNDETVSVDDVSVLTKAEAGFGLTNVDHWKVLFAVNKFLKKVQNDDSENSPENA